MATAMMLHSRILRENWFKAASMAAYDDMLTADGVPETRAATGETTGSAGGKRRPCRFFYICNATSSL